MQQCIKPRSTNQSKTFGLIFIDIEFVLRLYIYYSVFLEYLVYFEDLLHRQLVDKKFKVNFKFLIW